MSLQNDVEKRLLAPKLRSAENYAIAQSPIRYAPSQRSEAARARELEFLGEGLCVHGKYHRLLAQRIKEVFGITIPHCEKCPGF
jgi:hypothetical protein